LRQKAEGGHYKGKEKEGRRGKLAATKAKRKKDGEVNSPLQGKKKNAALPTLAGAGLRALPR
jgi:hypothetical protein